jgi:hypothetical protein
LDSSSPHLSIQRNLTKKVEIKPSMLVVLVL